MVLLVLLLLGKTAGLGLVAGGRLSRKVEVEGESAVAVIPEDRGLLGAGLLTGREAEGTSLAELALRWSGHWSWCWSGRECSGLDGSEAPPLFSCSRVSSTTSGAGFMLLFLSRSCSSLSAVLMVAWIS